MVTASLNQFFDHFFRKILGHLYRPVRAWGMVFFLMRKMSATAFMCTRAFDARKRWFFFVILLCCYDGLSSALRTLCGYVFSTFLLEKKTEEKQLKSNLRMVLKSEESENLRSGQHSGKSRLERNGTVCLLARMECTGWLVLEVEHVLTINTPIGV